jgi:hypothetical protein
MRKLDPFYKNFKFNFQLVTVFMYEYLFLIHMIMMYQDLRHELSSLARMPEPWVRIPLRSWMFSVCVVCAFFCVCVKVEALRRAEHLSKESYLPS